ncbi:MAG: hypothetical protein H6Q70_3249 [Firmicutes bacterium]|nr:hypothetical protein [Bacillota bacterium]
MIKKFMILASLFCMIFMMKSVAYAYSVNVNINIDCKYLLKSGETLQVFLDEKKVGTFTEDKPGRGKRRNGHLVHEIETSIDSEQKKHAINIKYIRKGQTILSSDFTAKENSKKELITNYYFDRNNIIKEK